MLRRNFLSKSIKNGLLAATGLSLTSFKPMKPTIQGRFIHMVFFWLKETTDIAEFKRATADLMEQIEEVVTYHVGEPAGTPREVVDNSYSVCLIATFNSKEDQDAYQIDPIHQSYVDQNTDKWTKVQIYDSWDA